MNKKASLLFSAIMVMGITSGCAKDGKPIAISGSATMGPVMKQIAEAYNQTSDRDVQVTEAGSLKGLSLLVSGKTDMVDSSVKIPAPLLWEAQKKGISIKEFAVGYDIIIPIIHPSNELNNLFLGRLADMYRGLIMDWKDVEGKPGKIIVVDRNDESGTKLIMSEKYFELETVVEGSIKKNCDVEVASYVSRHPRAVGYISKSFLIPGVKALKINGYSATVENVENKGYPLCRELYIYVNEKSYGGTIKSFMDYVISKKGQDIFEHQGFIPVGRLKRI